MNRFILALALMALASPAFAQAPYVMQRGIRLDSGTKTAAATAGAATLSKLSGKVTSEALTTAAAAVYTLTVTNTKIAAADIVVASVANGTNSAGAPVIQSVTPGAGSLVVVVRNSHASAAFNGTLVVSFLVVKN